MSDEVTFTNDSVPLLLFYFLTLDLIVVLILTDQVPLSLNTLLKLLLDTDLVVERLYANFL